MEIVGHSREVARLLDTLEIHEPTCQLICALSDYNPVCDCAGVEHLRAAILNAGLDVRSERQLRAESMIDAILSPRDEDRRYLKSWAENYRKRWPNYRPDEVTP